MSGDVDQREGEDGEANDAVEERKSVEQLSPVTVQVNTVAAEQISAEEEEEVRGRVEPEDRALCL